MTRAGKVAGLALGVAAALAAAPVVAEAHERGHGHGRWGRHHRGWSHGHGHHGGHHRDSYVKIVFRGRPYWYGQGRFYKKVVHSYASVPAPEGIIVQELPANHRTMIVDGVQYQCYDGVCYKGGPAGYMVVATSAPVEHACER